jgi:hypothetical protein
MHTGYKCRIRKRWYVVPSVWTPHAFLLRQVHQYPKLILNEAAATCTDTIHRVKFKHGAAPRAVAAAFLNSLTFAFAEIIGRSYGGGVLELEPNEAEKLLLPLGGADQLDIDELDRLLRAGNISAVLDITDRVLLSEGLGLSAEEIRHSARSGKNCETGASTENETTGCGIPAGLRLLLSDSTRAKQVKTEVVEAPDDLHIFACPIFTFVLNRPGQFWHTPLLEVVCILLVAVKVLVGVRPPGSYLVNGDRSEHRCRAVAAKVADHETGDAFSLSLLLPCHPLALPCVGERLTQGQPMFPAIRTQQVLALAVSLPGIPPVGELFATRY